MNIRSYIHFSAFTSTPNSNSLTDKVSVSLVESRCQDYDTAWTTEGSGFVTIPCGDKKCPSIPMRLGGLSEPWVLEGG